MCVEVGLRLHFQHDGVGSWPNKQLLPRHKPSQNIVGVGKVCQSQAHLAYQMYGIRGTPSTGQELLYNHHRPEPNLQAMFGPTDTVVQWLWAIDVQQRIKCHGAPAPFFLLIAGSPWVMLLLHANLLSEDRDTFGTLRSIQNDRSQCSAPPRPAVIRHPNNLSTSLVLVSSICGRDACHHPCNPLPSLTFTCRLSLIASLCFTRTPSCLPVVSYVICVSIL